MKEIIITSSVLIVAVLLLRLLFRNKVSRKLIYCAWLLVAIRLLIPVQFGHFNFSVLNQADSVTGIIEEAVKEPVSGVTREKIYEAVLSDYVSQGQVIFIPEVQEQIDAALPNQSFEEIYNALPEKGETILLPEVKQEIETKVQNAIAVPTLGQILKAVWLVGVGVMAIWFLAVNIRFGRRLNRTAELIECNDSPVPVKVSPILSSPCLFGIFRPTVYLTSHCEDDRIRRHVLTHELTHLRHKDHIWSLVRCACLCVYWFNPLVWIAAFTSKRDCELACDEAVLQQLGESERLTYGKTLVDMVASNPTPANLLETATAMHETKKALKERVNHIVKKKKHLLISALCLILVLSIVAGCSFTGKKDSTPTTDPSEPVGTTEPIGTTVPDSTTVPSTTEEPPVTTEPQPITVSYLTSVIYKNNQGDELIKEKYFYDENGNCIMKQMFSEYGTPCAYIVRTYNDKNQLSESIECMQNGEPYEKIYYIYDDNGRLVQTVTENFDYQKTYQTDYTYDSTKNITIKTEYYQNGKRHYVTHYDSNGNEIEQYLYSEEGTLQKKTIQEFDTNGVMTGRWVGYMSDTVRRETTATAEFDSTGTILTIQKYGSSGALRWKEINYFDEAGHVIKEEHYSNTLEFVEMLVHTYDEYGNLTSTSFYREITGELDHTVIYTYITMEIIPN